MTTHVWIEAKHNLDGSQIESQNLQHVSQHVASWRQSRHVVLVIVNSVAATHNLDVCQIVIVPHHDVNKSVERAKRFHSKTFYVA